MRISCCALACACAVVCHAAGPLMETPPTDFWSPFASPWFTPLIDEGLVGTHALFPGADTRTGEHTLVFGKRPGTGGDAWFSDLYVAKQFSAVRTAGFCLSGVDYASSVHNDSQSLDGKRRVRSESGRGAWSVIAWYEPEHNRVLKGVTLRAGDRRRSVYHAADDSLLGIGIERTTTSTEETAGALGITAMTAGPRTGYVRMALDFGGRFNRVVDWYQPATSEYTERYTGLKNNALRLVVSVGYLYVNTGRRTALFVNTGIHSGGMRLFGQPHESAPWKPLDTIGAQTDSLGAFVEGSRSRRIHIGPWEILYAIAGYWAVAFDWDERAAAVSWIERCRNERRIDQAEIVLPVLLRLRLGEQGYLFCSWRPSLVYFRARTLPAPGRTTVVEEARVRLTEGTMGVCWAPTERVRFAAAPSFSDGVLLSGVECVVVW